MGVILDSSVLISGERRNQSVRQILKRIQAAYWRNGGWQALNEHADHRSVRTSRVAHSCGVCKGGAAFASRFCPRYP